MQRPQDNTKQGFTIIEVVLVLAIAGLIFLMVFLALPALQRSQRNTQRRDDYAILSTYVTNYMTNHNGKLPSGDTIKSIDVNDNFADPELEPCSSSVTTNCGYTINVSESTPTGSLTKGQVYVLKNHTCENGTPTKLTGTNTNRRAFAIYGYIDGDTYCNASQ